MKAVEREFSEVIGGTAVTIPSQSVILSIPESASEALDREVTAVNSGVGSAVSKGDVLLEFNPTLFQQIVEEKQALLDKAKEELTVMTKLHEKNAASGLEVKTAEVAVKTAEVDLGMSQRDLELCVVKSPVDGVIEQMDVAPQMRLGGQTTLAVVHQLDPIYVQMDFPMERCDSLDVGQAAEVALDAFPQDTFTGKVVKISPMVSTKTRVLPVLIEVPNPGNRIRAGISGYARVSRGTSKGMAVPSVAIIKNKQKAMVVRVEDKRAKLQEVKTGSVVQAGYVEVLDGLNSGDEIVVYGQDSVRNDDVLNTQWEEWSGRDDLAASQP
ncbi:efflux RND transporter periplasmic adaptor subunit [Aeoliella straminimaris]|uniref:efflux RND transporter periplasmic adaptor subunit n=1 Tax=Aeoliella straminimaris TaxID=2954799 RepID=UPI002093E0D2